MCIDMFWNSQLDHLFGMEGVKEIGKWEIITLIQSIFIKWIFG